MTRRGTVFRRCVRCRKVVKDKRCPCGGASRWAFIVDVAPPGAPRRQLSRAGFDTKAEANAAMVKLLGEKEDGTYVEPSKLSVREYLDGYVAGAKLRATTRRSYRGAFSKLNGILGDVRLQHLDRAAIKRAYETLAATPRAEPTDGEDPKLPAPKTIHNVHLALSAALAAALEDRLIRNNPAIGAHHFSRDDDQEEIDYWIAEELDRFLRLASEHELAALFRLAAYTGMRRGELLGLRWQDVDLKGARLAVRQQVTRIEVEGAYIWGFGPPKTKKGRRTIDLDPGTLAILRTHKAGQAEMRLLMGEGYAGDLVFARADGRYLDPDVVSQTFDRLVGKAAVPVINLHGLRHTHATILLKAGTPTKVVSERLGHAKTSITEDLYQHVIPGMQRDAAAAFAAAIEG